jgi:hypothetical protein
MCVRAARPPVGVLLFAACVAEWMLHWQRLRQICLLVHVRRVIWKAGGGEEPGKTLLVAHREEGNRVIHRLYVHEFPLRGLFEAELARPGALVRAATRTYALPVPSNSHVWVAQQARAHDRFVLLGSPRFGGRHVTCSHQMSVLCVLNSP